MDDTQSATATYLLFLCRREEFFTTCNDILSLGFGFNIVTSNRQNLPKHPPTSSYVCPWVVSGFVSLTFRDLFRKTFFTTNQLKTFSFPRPVHLFLITVKVVSLIVDFSTFRTL